MTIAEQAALLLDALKPWAEACHGRAFIAADVIHCLDQLRATPGAPSAAILWQSEEPRGDHDSLGRVDRSFKLVISRGASFGLVPGESLALSASNAKPLFDLVEEAREIIRAIRLPSGRDPGDVAADDCAPKYLGAGPFEVNGAILDAFELRFALTAQIPQLDV